MTRRGTDRTADGEVVPMGERHDEPTFDDWVSHVFDHPVSQPEWYFTGDAAPWEDGFRETVPYLTRLFEGAGVLPDRFTPGQINQGFWYQGFEGGVMGLVNCLHTRR